MSNLWQLITNNPQIVFFFAIILFSVLGSAGKKFAEAKQKREIQHERQRREQEAMRTGRPVEDPQAEQAAEVEARKQRLAEMQQRREAQLEELRKRRQLMLQRQQARQQAGGAGQGGSGQSQSSPAQTPRQVGPQTQPQSQPQVRVTPSQQRPTPPRAAPAPRPARTARPTPTVSGTHPSSHPVAVARGMSGPSIAAHDDHPTLHESSTLSGLRDRHLVNKLGGDSIAEKTVSALAVNTMLTTRNDLRKAIIMSELLAKPVALRSQHDPWLD